MIRVKQSFSNSIYLKFCVYWQEYLSSAVSVFANSLKIYDKSKTVFLQLNLPEIHGEKG